MLGRLAAGPNNSQVLVTLHIRSLFAPVTVWHGCVGSVLVDSGAATRLFPSCAFAMPESLGAASDPQPYLVSRPRVGGAGGGS